MGLSHAHCPTIHHYNKNYAVGHAAIVQSATNANILVIFKNFLFFANQETFLPIKSFCEIL